MAHLTSPQRRHIVAPITASLVLVLASMSLYAACGASDAANENIQSPDNPNFNNLSPVSDMGVSPAPQEPPFIPELEDDFEFSQPAVWGEELFVANETLNTVAAIHAGTLAIRTIGVGARPVEVVGPTLANTSPAARVMSLDKGSDTVSVIDPGAGRARAISVMPNANRISAHPSGEWGVVWYDPASAESGDAAGDMASVTLLKGEQAYQIAVGFHVRRVMWVVERQELLILTDDGVSRVRLDEVTGDRVAVPIALLPAELVPRDPRDLEVALDPSGRYALARLASLRGFVMTTLEDGQRFVVPLPEIPTDLDIAARATPEAVLMLPNARQALRFQLPLGVQEAAALAAAQPVPPLEMMDMGEPPDLDMSEEMDPPDSADEEMDGEEMDALDMAEDMTEPDMAEDMTEPDMAEPVEEMMAEADMAEPDVSRCVIEAQGVSCVQLPQRVRLGAAVLSASGDVALFYTTLNDERVVVLHDLSRDLSREITFEKGVRSVVADEAGRTFLVFHTRVAGSGQVTATPGDPAFVAQSWGLSALDVGTGVARLVLTEHEPWRATLWSVEGLDPRAYVIFRRPTVESAILPSHRDVLGVNLVTFRVESLRVPSPPEGIGAIPLSGRVYINQQHPQGRVTFVSVARGSQQTVTGYQLNARIE